MDIGAILIIGFAALFAAFLLVIGLLCSQLMNAGIPCGKLQTVHGLFVGTGIAGNNVTRDVTWTNLEAALCQLLLMRLGRHLLPCAQVLIYPSLQMADFNLPSYQNHAVSILFGGSMVCFLQDLIGDLSAHQRPLPTELEPRYKKDLFYSNAPLEFLTVLCAQP
ncbi:LOW QUALITY PROTEIN: arylacetamide deacetylase-like 4 [Xenentodon cancila]